MSTTISSIDEFLTHLGYQPNDILCFTDDIKRRYYLTEAKDVTSYLYGSQGPRIIPNVYYSPCTFKTKLEYNEYFNRLPKDSSRGTRKKENVAIVRELVLDMDYGDDGHKHPDFPTLEDALNYLGEHFPAPTVLVKTGHGLHCHYRLEASLSTDYEKVAKEISTYFTVDSCNDCSHLFRFPFTTNKKPDCAEVPVEILMTSDNTYTLQQFHDIVSEAVKNGAKPLKKNVTTSPKVGKKGLKQIVDGVITRDRSETAFKIFAELLNIPGMTETKAVNAMKMFPEIYSHYSSEEACRADYRRVQQKQNAELPIQSVMPVDVLDCNDPITRFEPIRQLFDLRLFNTRNSKIDKTLSLFSHLYDHRNKAILSVPCSCGKTVSSIILAATVALNDRKHVWIVSEKIEDCDLRAKYLNELGVAAVSFHGRPSTCPHEPKEFRFAQKPCKFCQHQCGAELKLLGNNKYDYPEADVVCCTHANYLAAYMKNAITADLVIIDEAPNTLDTFSFTFDEYFRIANVVGKAKDARLILDKTQACWRDIAKADDKGTHKIEPITGLDKVISYIFAVANIGAVNEDDLEFALRYIYFFTNNTEIYGMKDGSNYSFIAGNVTMKTDVPTIILDGSARMQVTKWEGFTIYESRELSMSYPNTHIHLIRESPTQKSLEDTTVQGKIIAELEKIPQGETLILQNKNLRSESLQNFIDTLKQKRDNNVILHRGQHIGSNKGRDCTANVMAMSYFSTVSNYALRASIYNDVEIPESEIYREVEGVYYPAMTKNSGFVNEMLQEQYIKSFERDLYQAIMRGCIRKSADNSYHVVALCPSACVVRLLMEDLPDAVMHFGDEVENLYWSGYSEKQIVEMTGMPQKTINDKINSFRMKIGLVVPKAIAKPDLTK